MAPCCSRRARPLPVRAGEMALDVPCVGQREGTGWRRGWARPEPEGAEAAMGCLAGQQHVCTVWRLSWETGHQAGA